MSRQGQKRCSSKNMVGNNAPSGAGPRSPGYFNFPFRGRGTVRYIQ
jgi:hypothetical protein